jgi:hypothetical protein
MFDEKMKILKELMDEAGTRSAHDLKSRYRSTDGAVTEKDSASAAGVTENNTEPDLLLKDLKDPAIQKLLGDIGYEAEASPVELEGSMGALIDISEDKESLPDAEYKEPEEAPLPPPKKTAGEKEADEADEVNRTALDRDAKAKVKSRRLIFD